MIYLRGSGVHVGLVETGARLAQVRTPDRDGDFEDVALGLPEPDYASDTAYLGATVGRYANRIAGGTFTLDGTRYAVPCNEGGVALHGGPDGFDRRLFAAGPVEANPDGASVTFHRTSPDGENGFPGSLALEVTYTVHRNELMIEHTAHTDAPTTVNITNHAYWNLTGCGGTIENHLIQIAADHYLPVDAAMIPTGQCAAVDGTPFDLRRPTRIGARLRDGHPQLLQARGYDHTFVLGSRPQGGLRVAARLEEPRSGRTLTVLTDQPGVQFYSGNFLDGRLVLRNGRAVRQGDALCLEPQQFPNAPNEPSFPSTVLRPGELYRSRITLVFGVER